MTEDADLNIDFSGQYADRKKIVTDHLMKKDLKKALMESLVNPPLGAKDDNKVRRDSANLVAQVLSEYKEADMKTTVDDLNSEQVDLLVKYLYRALETGENTSAPLFKWHKIIMDKHGNGPIVRALVERRSL